MAEILLGLIGENIAQSRAPHLHRLAGQLSGHSVTYNRLEPKTLGLTFEEVLGQCETSGYRGVNVTHPYKEVAARLVSVADDRVGAIGAVNTVIFAPGGRQGFNTDVTGFKAAYRGIRGSESPGAVCVIGTGGAGRAIAFALLDLGAKELRLTDHIAAKATTLAEVLPCAADGVAVRTAADAASAARGADGLINCTPVGMIGYGGSPLARASMSGAVWAFDAVYTPRETEFLRDAAEAGAKVISGYDMFFHQGGRCLEPVLRFTGRSGGLATRNRHRQPGRDRTLIN